MEHQSSFDKMIVVRFLQYSAELFDKHIEQNYEGVPVILGICLYHNTHSNHTPGSNHKIDLESHLFHGKEGPHAGRSQLICQIKLVDLTAAEMDYARIASHGYAAILEFFLKDAHLSGDAFIAQAKKHLASSSYKKMSNNTFFEFKLSLYEYILSLGEKPSEELITTLVEVVPEEEKIMRTAADQLRLEGKLEGRRERDREVITNMQSQGHSPKLIKEVLQISDETYEKLSPTSANSEMLAHHMTNLGAAELIHDTNNKTVADNTIIGTVFKGNG